MIPQLRFLGAAGMVTGSRFLLTLNEERFLIDCGMFQGSHQLEDMNWAPLPFDPAALGAVILTHAHLDHTGFLPRLVKDGFHGPVYATEATCDLLGLVLPDSGHLQEEQAHYANKKGYSHHKPALPLYTADDAARSLRLLQPVRMSYPFKVGAHLTVTMRRSGHILGAAVLECEIAANGSPSHVVFSGDLGAYDQEIMKPPATIESADYLVVESTYGDRERATTPVEDQMQAVVNDAIGRGGVLLVPSFAIGRAQIVLYYLHKLEEQGRIPHVPVYLDSPMAVDATDIYCKFGDDHNLNMALLTDPVRCPLRSGDTHFVRSVDESKRLNQLAGPAIIISANGMCEGGRIMHHLKQRLPDARNSVMLVGYQADGTRGRLLRDGADWIRIHGEQVPVRAKVRSITGLSAHGDYHDILRWLSGFEHAPRRTFIVHGEQGARESLDAKITERLGWSTTLPALLQTVSLE